MSPLILMGDEAVAQAALDAAELLDETLFYREGHRRIFRAALALHQGGAVVEGAFGFFGFS